MEAGLEGKQKGSEVLNRNHRVLVDPEAHFLVTHPTMLGNRDAKFPSDVEHYRTKLRKASDAHVAVDVFDPQQ
jgi:hypothetical protein